ncbi:MAG: nucleotidyltransferase family protein [bacterium]
MKKVLNKEDILNFLREKKPFLEKKFGVKKIALFGSYARDEQKPNSDIDLIVELEEKDFKTRFYIKEYLGKEFNKKVNLGYLDNIRKFIRDEVEKDLIYA